MMVMLVTKDVSGKTLTTLPAEVITEMLKFLEWNNILTVRYVRQAPYNRSIFTIAPALGL